MINRARRFSNTKEPSSKKRLCIVFFTALFAIYQICCFSNGWLVNGDEYMGLWQLCSQELGCLWMERSPSYDVLFLDWFASIRALLLLTTLFTAFAIMFQIFNIYCDHTISMFPVRGCAIFTAIYLTLTIFIFPVKKPSTFADTWELGWTYYVTCAACLFSFIQVYVTFKVGNNQGPSRSNLNHNGESLGFQYGLEMQPPLRSTDPTSVEVGDMARDDWTINDKSYFQKEASPLPKKVNISVSSEGSISQKSSRTDSVSSKGSASSSGSSSYSSESDNEDNE